MARRIKIKDLLDAGFLKPNEEIYMEYRGLHFTARVLPDGKISGERGISKSLSYITFVSQLEDRKYRDRYYDLFGIPKDIPMDWDDPIGLRKRGSKKGVHVTGGWRMWKTWNGTKLDELRTRLFND